MIILTVMLSIVVVLLLPIHMSVDIYIDLDNHCLVVLMSMYGIIFFDSLIDTDGININYKGSINGSIPIVDIDFVDIDDIILALDYRRIKCHVSADMSNCKYMGAMSAVLALSSMIAPIVNGNTNTTMSTVGAMGKANYINLIVGVSTTPCAIIRALS